MRRYLTSPDYDLQGMLRGGIGEAEANHTAIMNAINSTSGAPGFHVKLPRTVLPGGNTAYIHKPIRPRNGITLSGEKGLSSTIITPTFEGPEIFVAKDWGPCPHGPPLLTGEDFSWDFREDLETSMGSPAPRFFDFRNINIWPRGWSQFNFEINFRFTGSYADSWQSGANVWVIGGKRLTSEGYTVAMQLQCYTADGHLTDRRLRARVRIGSNNFDFFTPYGAPTNLEPGVDYHACIDWDGTTLRYFFGLKGALVSLIASSPAAGLFTAKGYEVPHLGMAGYGAFPSAESKQLDSASFQCGSMRLSNVSRRTAAYTAPTAAYTPDANDYICMVPTTNGSHGKEDGEFYFTKTRNRDAWIPLTRMKYDPTEGVTICDFTFNGMTGGRGSTAVMCRNAIGTRLERLTSYFCGTGFTFENNCYLSAMDDCYVRGGYHEVSAGVRATAIQSRFGFLFTGASGVVRVQKLRAQSFGYLLGCHYASLEMDQCWMDAGMEVGAVFWNPATMRLRGLSLSSEGQEPGVALDAALMMEMSVGGLNQHTVIEVNNENFFNQPPFVISSQAVSANVLKFEGRAIAHSSAPEYFKFVNPSTTPPIEVDMALAISPNVPLTVTGVGKIIVSGQAHPGASLTDANATLLYTSGPFRRLPAGTPLTADRVWSLSLTDWPQGRTMRIVREGLGAFTATINDHLGAPLYVMPASKTSFVEVQRVNSTFVVCGFGVGS